MPLKIIVDSREQRPLDFSRWTDVTVVPGTLSSGDYSIVGLEDRFSIERKSLDDLASSLTHGRDRFTRELERLRSFEVKCIVAECTLEDVAKHRYKSKALPESLLQSLAAFHVRYGVPVIWCGSPAGAAYQVRALARWYIEDAQKRLQAIVEAAGEGKAA